MGIILEVPIERPLESLSNKFIDLLCKLSVRNTPVRVALTHSLSFRLLTLMKPTVTEDEFEDAEEENKFINEVRVSSRV